MTLPARHAEGTAHQRRADSAVAAIGGDGDRAEQVPPSGAITTPSGDMTITAGSAINFGTNTSAANYSWVFPGGSPATSTARNPGNVTFNTPGMYTVSLTVIDATGNSDPNPPTRTIMRTSHQP